MGKLTEDEVAAEKQRKADLAADIERKDDTELKLFAQQLGLDPEKYAARMDLVAAIELKAEADAAASRQRIRDIEDEEGKKIAGQDGDRPPAARVIRALNREFCCDVPQEGRGGSFEPDEDHQRFGGDYDVPNGKYRVAGSEWVFQLQGKKLVSAIRATEQNKFGGKGVVTVD